MDKWSMITDLALWVTILTQWLTIHDLKKRIENEKKWAEWWQDKWLDRERKESK